MDAHTLRQAMQETHVSDAKLAEYLPHFVEAMRAAQITNARRAAMWCAQIGHESAGLRYMEEIADGSAYNGRRDLGNTHPGDGPRFKGRGPIQLTGRNNYGVFSRWAHGQGLVSSPSFFVDNPTLVATPRWGFLAAAWYWTVARPQINSLCDERDLEGVTRAINGGTNGLADRRARWQRCLQLGDAILPRSSAPSRPAQPEVHMQTVPLERANDILAYIWSKNGLPYHFGGSGNPGGDCSWFVMAVAAMLEGKPPTRRYGSTETYRTARGNVLGCIKAPNRGAVPADAILKIGLSHRVNPTGPYGGANAHMSGTFMGVAFESRGMYRGVQGHVVGGTARAWNDGLYHEFWYYPARLGAANDPTRFPLPAGWYYGPLEGPLNSISGEAGEPAPWIDGIKTMQARLSVPQSGKWIDAKPAIISVQSQMGDGIIANGTVGPKTWAHIMNQPAPDDAAPPPPRPPEKLDLNTVVRSLVPGSETEAPLGHYILTADLHSHETRKLVEQLLDQVASIQARLASGGDQTGGQ